MSFTENLFILFISLVVTVVCIVASGWGEK